MHPLLGTWPTTQACALTGNQTSNPLVHRLALNPLSHTSQGEFMYILHPTSLNGNNLHNRPMIKTQKLTLVQCYCCTVCGFHYFSPHAPFLFHDLLQDPHAAHSRCVSWGSYILWEFLTSFIAFMTLTSLMSTDCYMEAFYLLPLPGWFPDGWSSWRSVFRMSSGQALLFLSPHSPASLGFSGARVSQRREAWCGGD